MRGSFGRAGGRDFRQHEEVKAEPPKVEPSQPQPVPGKLPPYVGLPINRYLLADSDSHVHRPHFVSHPITMAI